MSDSQFKIDRLSTRELLNKRICDLNLTLTGSPLELQIGQLNAELKRKGIRFKPYVWISTAWFSPYGVPGFALPFYLLHPRLKELEQKYIGEVEGGTEDWCMKLLRHETGHAIDNAFHLRKSKQRQLLFGCSGQQYPKEYSPNPNSRNFVHHLNDHYAQAHPDEDWAETFAVWLTPESDWKREYKDWGALKKLELIDRLLKKIKGKKQLTCTRDDVEEVAQCNQTLREYFENKQSKFALTSKQLQNKTVKRKKIWISM